MLTQASMQLGHNGPETNPVTFSALHVSVLQCAAVLCIVGALGRCVGVLFKRMALHQTNAHYREDYSRY